MTKPPRITPTDADVRRLLAVSRTSNDPRAAAATTFVLAFSTSIGQLRRLHWSDLKLGSWAGIVADNSGGRRIDLTELCLRQLLSIKQVSRSPHPFGKLDPTSPSINQLFRALIDRAGLSKFCPQDFVQWSLQQTPAIRKSVATA